MRFVVHFFVCSLAWLARATVRSFVSFHALNTHSTQTYSTPHSTRTANESTKQNARRQIFAHCKLENRRKGNMKTLLFTYWSNDYICEQRCVLINIYYCLLQSICVEVTSSRCSSTGVTSEKLKIPSNSFMWPIDGGDCVSRSHHSEQMCI